MGEVPNAMNSIEDPRGADERGKLNLFKKTPVEMYEENYKGFAATSVVDAHKKGFFLGCSATTEECKSIILEIVDLCFHAYASSFRVDARKLVEEILEG